MFATTAQGMFKEITFIFREEEEQSHEQSERTEQGNFFWPKGYSGTQLGLVSTHDQDGFHLLSLMQVSLCLTSLVGA